MSKSRKVALTHWCPHHDAHEGRLHILVIDYASPLTRDAVVDVERVIERPVQVERIVERVVEVPVERIVEVEKLVGMREDEVEALCNSLRSRAEAEREELIRQAGLLAC